MARVIALMTLAALVLTEAPVHEPVHGRGAHPSPLCYCAEHRSPGLHPDERLGGRGHTGSRPGDRLRGYPPSADPDQVTYADQSRRLIERELDESGVTQFGQKILGRLAAGWVPWPGGARSEPGEIGRAVATGSAARRDGCRPIVD